MNKIQNLGLRIISSVRITTTVLDPPPHPTNRVDRICYTTSTTICCQIKPKDTTPTPFFTWHYVRFLIHRCHCFQQLRQQRRAALLQVFESFWLHHHCKNKTDALNYLLNQDSSRNIRNPLKMLTKNKQS